MTPDSAWRISDYPFRTAASFPDRPAAILGGHRLSYGQLAAEVARCARALLAHGKTHEARAELDFAGGGPITYRLLASLPASLIRGLIRTRRAQSWAHGCLAALTRMIVECLP